MISISVSLSTIKNMRSDNKKNLTFQNSYVYLRCVLIQWTPRNSWIIAKVGVKH